MCQSRILDKNGQICANPEYQIRMDRYVPIQNIRYKWIDMCQSSILDKNGQICANLEYYDKNGQICANPEYQIRMDRYVLIQNIR